MTRLEKRTLADAARQLGLTTEAAKKRRQRCEPILVDAILSGEVEAATSLTISSGPSRGVEEDVSMISVRSRSSDTQPETTTRKGGRGSLTGSARIPHLPASRKPRRRVVRVLVVVGIAAAVVAAAVADGGNATATVHAAAPPTRPDQLEKVFTNLRNWIVGLLATLATLMFTIGGLRYLVAGGDPGEVQKAKVAFKAAALGYALAVLAPLFVNVLKHVVGG
ncbi:pilin [Microbispora triticiradicis]|uniref:pilin n=1 Tax=Microbispora TaxID=2005 RepID=UPI001FCBFB7B|nr:MULTISPECIES: pilin [Microbispora]